MIRCLNKLTVPRYLGKYIKFTFAKSVLNTE